MPLQVGTRRGHYDVTALIVEGGMGQVYRARTPYQSDSACGLSRPAQAGGEEPSQVTLNGRSLEPGGLLN